MYERSYTRLFLSDADRAFFFVTGIREINKCTIQLKFSCKYSKIIPMRMT